MGDADITLRHIVRRHPEALVQALGVEGRVEIVGWLDTQVTALERRLDKALGLRIEGELRALHVEFEYELTKSVGRRLYEYQALFNLGRSRETPDDPVPPIESLVVVLTGRKKAWPDDGNHRTGWLERPWSGIHYRIDAVYQRTVDELRGRGNVLWSVFVPLVRDATLEAVQRVIKDLRAHVLDAEELGDLLAAMLVMADVDPWGHNLREEIAVMLQSEGKDLMEVSKTLREAFERGQRAGLEKGIEAGIERGREKGLEEGRRQAVEQMLSRLFMRRLGRALTEQERQALATRAKDPDEAQEHALSLEGEALVAWLLDPGAK
ncbi:MAG: hypothetical protein QM820_17575 [Minicystis sp.]